MKQIVNRSLLVLLAVMVLAVGACSKGNDTGNKPQKTNENAANTANTETAASGGALEPIKFSIFVGSADPGSPPAEDPIHKYIREELGVDIQIVYSPGDSKQKLNLMLASGDYPDAISTKCCEEMKPYADNGHLVAVDDYLAKYVPELKAKMDVFKNTYTGQFKDKKYWYVPGGWGYSKEYPLIEPMIGIRYDLWKEQGLPKLATLDDVYEYGKKAQDAHPRVDNKKAYAFSAWFGDWGFWAYHAMLRLGGKSGWYGVNDFNNNGKYTWLPFDQDFIYLAKFLNRAYREGYADPEGAVQKHEQYMQKLNDGRLYINYYGGDWMDGVANRARIAAGKPEQRIFPYSGLKIPGYSGEPLTGQYFPTGGGFGLFITKNCKNPEEIIKRLSKLWTEEGNVITGMGLEGVHWTLDDKGFRKPKDDLISLARQDKNWMDKSGVGKYKALLGGYVDGFDSRGDSYNLAENKYYLEGTYDEIDKQIFEQLKITNYNDLPKVGRTQVDWWMAGSIDFDSSTKEAQTFKKMNESVDKWLPKLYLAKSEPEFDALLKQFQKDNEKLGYKQIEDIVNERITKMYEENKDNIDKY